ncbi:MAG: histidine kinase dimerization/phospho-acceptor domain-containing protein, partial [Chloroflexota bacterium]
MASFLALSRGTRLYVTVVVAASVGVGYLLIVHPLAVRVPHGHILPLVVIFGVASLATELRTITTPAGDHKTITSAMFIALILLVGSTYTLPAVGFSMVAALVILRRPWFKIVFNVAEYILTVGVSGMVYQTASVILGGRPIPNYNAVSGIVALGLLAVTYFVANSGLVAGVVALSEGRQFFYIWSLTNVEMLAQYAAMVVVGIIIAMLWEAVPWSIALIAVILIGVYISFALAESLQMAQRDLLLRMDELQRRTAELALLNQINEALTRAPDLARLWDVMYEQAGRVFDTACFFVALRDDHGDSFRVAFGRAFDLPIDERTIQPPGGLIGLVEECRRPLLLVDDDAARVDDGLGLAWASPRQSVLAAPLIVEGTIRGVIAAESGRPHAYSDDDRRVLAAIADQAAVAVEKTRVQKEATEARALHRLNTLKTEFVSTVSHELRSPLTPIVGFSELLSATAVDSSRVRDMGAEILRHAQRMQRLVDDLLDVS